MDLIPNTWKHLLRTKASQKSFVKTFYYNNKDTRKTKYFQKLSNKEINFIFQSTSTKYNQSFKFILLANFFEGHHFLSPKISGKTFADWLKKCSDGYIFSDLQYIKWTTHETSYILDVKNEKSLTRIWYCKVSITTLVF